MDYQDENGMCVLSEDELELVGGGAIPLLLVVFGASFGLGFTGGIAAGVGASAR
jgi:lactobin A/cerein 7B family class IIb bacteriocin